MNYWFTHIKFPIVAFKNRRHLHFARNEDEISICTRTAFKKGFYNDLTIIDSDGVQYQVQNAEKIANIGPFWGYNIFLNQKIKVKLITAKLPGPIELSEFREWLKTALKTDAHLGGSGDDFKRTMHVLSGLETHGELIKYLSDAFYKEY